MGRGFSGHLAFDVASAVTRSAIALGGGEDDDHRWMLMRGDSLGKFGAADRYTRLLVQGVPIPGRWKRNGQRLLPYRDVRCDRQNQRLFERRG
jgi:hypothetical protein